MNIAIAIFITSAVCTAVAIPLLDYAYHKGILEGVRLKEMQVERANGKSVYDALLSEYDGVDDGNGDIRRMSHGEIVQKELEVKNKNRKQ